MYCPRELAKKLSLYIILLKEEITRGSEFTRNGDDQGLLISIEKLVTILNQYPHNSMLSWLEIAHGLNLIQHPEGGYYRRFSWTKVRSKIFYLLPAGAVSSWHRLKGTKEVFKYMSGATLHIPQITRDFRWSTLDEVGQNKDVVIMEGEDTEEFYERDEWGNWFGAYLNDGDYSFVVCECSPPFEFSKFQMATVHDVSKFRACNPTYQEVIGRLGRTIQRDEGNIS